MADARDSRPTSSALRAWQALARWPGGRWLFSRAVCFRAPYFAGIRPAVVDLRPGRCEVRIARRRAVTNHLGTVHAIAMCNMAELAAGLATDATLPATHRWIPRAMSVEYLRKATTGLRGVAEVPAMEWGPGARDVAVPVAVTDAAGECVFRAVVTMRVSPRRVQAAP